jgi:hypothetical protein
LCRCRPWCRSVHGRMADGICALGRSVRTVGCFADGHGRAALAAFAGLKCAPGPGASPGVCPARVIARDEGRDGSCADGWAGGAGERVSNGHSEFSGKEGGGGPGRRCTDDKGDGPQRGSSYRTADSCVRC